MITTDRDPRRTDRDSFLLSLQLFGHLGSCGDRFAAPNVSAARNGYVGDNEKDAVVSVDHLAAALTERANIFAGRETVRVRIGPPEAIFSVLIFLSQSGLRSFESTIPMRGSSRTNCNCNCVYVFASQC